MKLVWVLCFCLIGKLHAASPAEERAAAESSLGSGYMMAFPMNDEDQLAEESAEAAVKTLAEALVGKSDDDSNSDDEKATDDAKEPVIIVAEEEEKKGDDGDESSVEPVGILEAQLAEEEAPAPPRRPLFKRPKIEELRKILGFPSNDGAPQKAKEIPPEKPKAFQPMFPKTKPKMESTPNGLQISLPLRREDRMRPFGFPILPRNDGIRPIGFPDLVQAASSIIRRAIIDDMDVQDINNKDDKDEDDDDDNASEEHENNDEHDDDEDDEDDDEPLVIVPIPDGKDDPMPMPRPPLFRRFPLPLPFPVPRPMPASRPRIPMPPLAPVAFFLPLAQQIMHNIMTRPAPRSQPPPVLPISPVQHLIPIQPPMQNLIPIMQNMVPVQQSMVQQNMVPVQQPMVHFQHHMIPVQTPVFPIPQQTIHTPILVPLPNVPRPVVRPMPRRMPMHQQTMARRMPMPNPMARIPMPQPRPQPLHQVPPQFVNPMLRRPAPEPAMRSLPRSVRPPQLPLHPVLLMMSPAPNHIPFITQQQQQVPVFHRPPQVPLVQQVPYFQRQLVHVPAPQEEERVIFVREDPEEQDDDQEVLLLVPTDEVEVAQRPPAFMPRPVVRPPMMMSPLQRISLLRELLMARQANRQAAQMQPMPAQPRSPRIVEIVQQQLRIIPTPHHQRGQLLQSRPTRADASELHPVYVPYPSPQ